MLRCMLRYILNNVYAQADVDIVYVELILLQLNDHGSGHGNDAVISQTQFLCYDEHGSKSADYPRLISSSPAAT